MNTEKNKFANGKEFVQLVELLANWKHDPQNIKAVFGEIKAALLKKDHTVFNFISRPGISYSLRAGFKNRNREKHLFALVDIIDDDRQNRWLSLCFYTEMITDSEELGNLVPEGILGLDGYCFDLFEFDRHLISYAKQKIDEAYAYVTGVGA